MLTGLNIPFLLPKPPFLVFKGFSIKTVTLLSVSASECIPYVIEGVWRWCSSVWRRVEGCGGGVVVCGGVWRGVEVV